MAGAALPALLSRFGALRAVDWNLEGQRMIEGCYRMFGMKVQQTREVLGLTQAELSKRVGLTRTSVVNIEAGRQRILMHHVEKFATAFQVTPKVLLRGIWT